jgi:rod shape-determining protein MreC
MQQLLNFFLKFRNLILFLILLNISLALTVNVHDYHKSKLLNFTSTITGSINDVFSGISSHFNLKNENKILLLENNRLKHKVRAREILRRIKKRIKFLNLRKKLRSCCIA